MAKAKRKRTDWPVKPIMVDGKQFYIHGYIHSMRIDMDGTRTRWRTNPVTGKKSHKKIDTIWDD